MLKCQHDQGRCLLCCAGHWRVNSPEAKQLIEELTRRNEPRPDWILSDIKCWSRFRFYQEKYPELYNLIRDLMEILA